MTDTDKAVELARLAVNANAKLEGVAADIALDLARAVLAMAVVVEAARRQDAAYAAFCLVDEDENDDRPWLAVLAASRATETAIRALDSAGEVRCDGDHGEPACSDAGCWQRDSEEVNRG